MPEMDGYEVFRRLTANSLTRRVPVIFIILNGETTKQVEGFKAGGIDYISKPFEDDVVLAWIRTHFRLHELTERLEQQIDQRTRELRKEILECKQIENDLRNSEAKFRELYLEILYNKHNYLEIMETASIGQAFSIK